MRQTLRRRFILFAMSAVTVLLAVLVGAIAGLSWVVLDSQADALLHSLARGQGQPTPPEPPPPRPFAPPVSPDAMQSLRFFTVRTSPQGHVLEVDLDHISSVTPDQAAAYAGQAAQPSGRIEGYKYEVRQLGEDRLTVFLDVSRQQGTFVMVLSLSSAMALVCWLGSLALVALFSRRAVRPILAGLEKQKQFITNAGHELKTPLAIIQSSNDAAAMIYGETKYNRSIRQQAQRLNGLMTELLTLARLEEAASLPTERVDVSQAFWALLPGYEEQARGRGLSIRPDIQPGVVLSVHKTSFLQLVSTLLDNGVKYTPEGGAILFSIKSQAGHVWVVEENPCALPQPQDPEQLFERFYRGDPARTQQGGVLGFGIGLSAARTIAEALGGRLTAEYPQAGRIRFTARF